MDAVLTLEGASLGYGDGPVLEGVDLECRGGEVLLVLGRSGSGKSTLLRAVAGLLRPTAGRVAFRGRGVAWVPQADRLDGRHPVTAAEVVAAGLGARAVRPLKGGRLRGEDRARVTEALERLGLGDVARRPFRELSGGQRQRVLVARALVVGGDLVVLDEPTSALDDEAALLVDGALRGEAARGAAVVLATHDRGRVGRGAGAVPVRAVRVAAGALEPDGEAAA